MLVFGDACIRNTFVAIVEHRATLHIALVNFLHKIKCAIPQSAVCKTKECVNWSGPHHMVVRVCATWVERGTQMHRDRWMIKDRFHDGRIAVFWNSLKRMIEVRVVGSKAQRQSRKNAGWQRRWLFAPLLFGIPLKERFVQFATYKTQGLIFKRHRVRNRLVGLFGDECFGLFRREIGAKEIVDQR